MARANNPDPTRADNNDAAAAVDYQGERFPRTADDVAAREGESAWTDGAEWTDYEIGASAMQGAQLVDVDVEAGTVLAESPKGTREIPIESVYTTNLETDETVTIEYTSIYSGTRVEREAVVTFVADGCRNGFEGITVERADDGTQMEVSATGGVSTYAGDDHGKTIGRDAVVTRAETDDSDDQGDERADVPGASADELDGVSSVESADEINRKILERCETADDLDQLTVDETDQDTADTSNTSDTGSVELRDGQVRDRDSHAAQTEAVRRDLEQRLETDGGRDVDATAEEIEAYVREHVTEAHEVQVNRRPLERVSWSWDVIVMTIDHPEALGDQLERELGLELDTLGAKSDAFRNQYAGIVIQLAPLDDQDQGDDEPALVTDGGHDVDPDDALDGVDRAIRSFASRAVMTDGGHEDSYVVLEKIRALAPGDEIELSYQRSRFASTELLEVTVTDVSPGSHPLVDLTYRGREGPEGMLTLEYDDHYSEGSPYNLRQLTGPKSARDGASITAVELLEPAADSDVDELLERRDDPLVTDGGWPGEGATRRYDVAVDVDVSTRETRLARDADEAEQHARDTIERTIERALRTELVNGTVDVEIDTVDVTDITEEQP